MNAYMLPTPDFSDWRRENTRRKTAPRASPGGIAKWIHLGFAMSQGGRRAFPSGGLSPWTTCWGT